jgi:hypothetical protein
MPPPAVPPAERPSPREFIAAFRPTYVAAWGGVLSVVVAVVAVVFPIPSGQLVVLTAIIAGVLSAYAIWAQERTLRVATESVVTARAAELPDIVIGYRIAYRPDVPNETEYLELRNIGAATATHVRVDPLNVDGRLIFALNDVTGITALMPSDPQVSLRATGLHQALVNAWISRTAVDVNAPPRTSPPEPYTLPVTVSYTLGQQWHVATYVLSYAADRVDIRRVSDGVVDTRGSG